MHTTFYVVLFPNNEEGNWHRRTAFSIAWRRGACSRPFAPGGQVMRYLTMSVWKQRNKSRWTTRSGGWRPGALLEAIHQAGR